MAENPLCKYRHVFGIEEQGAHSYRVFNIAIVDMMLTIIGSWFIARYMKKPFWFVFIIVLVIGTIIHRMFCVKTTITRAIFGEKY